MHTILMIILIVALILYGDGYRAYVRGQVEKAFILFTCSASLLLVRIIAQTLGG